MMFEEFYQLCRAALVRTSRELDALAAYEHVSERDNAAAQSSQLLALSAVLAVGKRVDRATFLTGAGEAYDDATEKRVAE